MDNFNQIFCELFKQYLNACIVLRFETFLFKKMFYSDEMKPKLFNSPFYDNPQFKNAISY